MKFDELTLGQYLKLSLSIRERNIMEFAEKYDP